MWLDTCQTLCDPNYLFLIKVKFKEEKKTKQNKKLPDMVN